MASFNRTTFLLILTVMMTVIAVACSSSSGESEISTPNATNTAQTGSGGSSSTPGAATPSSAIPTVASNFVLSAPSLPTRPVTFSVQAPANTPPGDSVYIMVEAVPSGYQRAHVELQPNGNGTYSGEIDLPVNGMVRYAYDRWNEVGCCEDTRITRESLFTGDTVGYRSLIVDAGGTEGGSLVVRDVVPQWNDLETEFVRKEVSGRIVDSETSEPLMDVDVTVAGVHVATDFDGRFVVPGIVPGPHRIVANTAKGDYAALQQEVTVGDTDLALTIDIRMKRAQIVPVRFTVALPESTPPDAGVFIGGNLRQLGARPGSGPNLPLIPSGISIPMMSRAGDLATTTIDLPVGAYIEYYYTLGPEVSSEVANHDRRFRTFIVDETGSGRNDEVVAWGNEGWPLVTLRVDVPVNTPEGVPVYLRDGPTHQMNQVAPHQWVTVVGSHPPGAEYGYSISLGDDMFGSDGTPGTGERGRRILIVPDASSEVAVKVSKWAHLPDPTLRDNNNGLTLKFRLSVPVETPENATIVLTGNRPAIGSNGTTMQPVPGNPWLYEAEVNFAHDGQLRYRYTVAESGNSSDEFTISTDFHGQEVNDYVASWDGPADERDGWISGLFMPDFWSESFLPSSASAFEAGAEHNGEWVAISSVWSFGEILPEPYIESRPVRIWTVLTPIDDIRAQAAVAREKGMKVFLAPQMNPEVHPGWQDQTVSVGSTEW